MRPASVLLLVFVVLKLTDNVPWSWPWVLSPFWIPAGLWLGLSIVSMALELFGIYLQRRARRKAGMP